MLAHSDHSSQVRITEYLHNIQEVADRLQSEHTLLELRLAVIQAMAEFVGSRPGIHNWQPCLLRLKEQLLGFMREMDDHAGWEDDHLFPLVTMYYGGSLETFDEMEQAHHMAKLQVTEFILTVEQTFTKVPAEQAKLMCLPLVEACARWREHFTEEEKLITLLENRSNGYGF